MSCRIRSFITAILLLLPALFSGSAAGQTITPGGLDLPLPFGELPDEEESLKISAVLKKIDASRCALEVTMTVPPGCYTYSMNPSFGSATAIKLTEDGGLKPDGDWQADREPKSSFDQLLMQQVEKFYDRVVWTRVFTGDIKPGLMLSGSLRGQWCTDRECRPILNAKFTATLADDAPTGLPEAAAAATASHLQTVTPKIGFGKAATAGLVTFDVSLSPASAKVGDEVLLQLKTTVAEDWHIFALDQDPEMQGTPTEISLETAGLEAIDADFSPSRPPEIENPTPDVTQRVHYDEITWSRRFRVTAEGASAAGKVRFQICQKVCKPPTTAEFRVALAAAPGITKTPSTTPATTAKPPVPPNLQTDSSPPPETPAAPAAPAAATTAGTRQNFFAFMVTAITAGFVALATPCVFPMIPITVAFFLKQEEKRTGSSLKLAVVYCLSIIGAFTILGLAMARAFGGTSLTTLANNPWLNLFFSALFVFFALMLLGLFEFRVPNWLLNFTAQRESTGGFVGVVFMALTFTLVSFTCTFAFVGSLLVIAAQGDYLWPILGMLGFSTAFASPFFFLALFPGLLKKMPRSGGWMNDVKFVIGLVELAAVAKFLSVADIGLSANAIPVVVTYEVFLWSWIILSAFAGLYLIRRQNGAWPKFSVTRLLFTLGFLGFAGRLAAGLYAPSLPADPVWNLVAAFAPPQIKSGDVFQQEELGYVIIHHDQAWSLEYQKAAAAAQKSALPLLVEITGVNCVNCRQMERTVLAQKVVLENLESVVRAQLYIDEVPGIADPALKESILEANINFASDLLGDVSMPSYAIVSPDGKQVYKTFSGLDQSGGTEFLKFLKEGLGRFKQANAGEVVGSRE